MASVDLKEIVDVEHNMAGQFKLKDIRALNHYLNMHIVDVRADRCIYIIQVTYIENIQECVCMEARKPIVVPIQ